MMKVLMTADTIGGVWTYAVQLAAALQPHDVQFVLCSTGRLPSYAQRCQIRQLSNVRLFESSYKLEWMQDPWDDVDQAQQWLLDIASTEQPDIVHLNDFSHGAASWSSPVIAVAHSCVLSWHEAVRRSPVGDEWTQYKSRVTAGIRKADAVVAPSRSLLGAIQKHYGPLNQGTVIYNGLACDDSAEIADKDQCVLAAGRFWDEAKNIATLARAAQAVQCPVYLAGDAVHPDGHRCDISGLQCLGPLTPDALATYYRRAAIYALPARYEPFGYTPLEAAQHGCALVLGDIPSLREVWQDAATYVPPDDDAALADAINHLLNNPDVLRRRARAARQRASAYTPATMADRYRMLYRQLLAGRPAGSRRSALCAL